MSRHKKGTIGTGIFIFAILFGDMFGGNVFKWAWIIGVGALFIFFAIVPDDNKPKKSERE